MNRFALLENLDGLAPGLLLAVVDLAQIEHRPLHHSPTAHAPVLDQTVIAVLLAVLLSDCEAQKHNAVRLLCILPEPWK